MSNRHGGSPDAIQAVLVHGFGCDARFWEPQARYLRRCGWNLWVPDLPFHGGPTEGVERSLQGLARWLLDACEGRPRVFVGHSLGGMIALQIARDAPDLVAGIALVDSFPDLRLSASHLPGMFLEGAHQQVRAWVEATREGIIQAMPQATYDAIWPSVRDFCALPWLGEIDCPVLGIYGGRRLYSPHQAAQLAADLMLDHVAGRHKVVVIPGAAHFVSLECPDQVSAALEQWGRTLGA